MRYLTILLLVGCVGEIGGAGGDDTMEPEEVTCEQARTYTGFGGNALESDRPKIEAGSDRMRIKPFASLSAEYTRALELASFDTAPYAATFGRPPARWYNEPQASANTVYAAFALAYDACTRRTALGGDYNTAPEINIANRLCKDFAMRAWQREADAAETTACATYAIEKTNPADAPAKRWAYTCAAVLTASGFLAY